MKRKDNTFQTILSVSLRYLSFVYYLCDIIVYKFLSVLSLKIINCSVFYLKDEYIIDPRMLVAIIINCLILDLAFMAMLFHFLCKICPIIRQKIYRFKACEKEKKLECETSTSTPSTVKKDVISVDNVVFETD